MSEAKSAAKLKKENPRILIKNVSDKFGEGTPDRCILMDRQGEVVWAELKYLEKLPRKKKKIGLKPKQASWLEEWKRRGGTAVVVAAIGELNKVAVIPCNFKSIQTDGATREELISFSCDYDDFTDELWEIINAKRQSNKSFKAF